MNTSKVRKSRPKLRKSRWSPNDKDGALSLMRQVTRAFLAGHPLDDPTQPHTIAANIPIMAANYLIEAFAAIEAGIDANNALCLKQSVGGTQKQARHTVIAIEIDDLRRKGMLREDAVEAIGKKYHLSPSGADSAYRLGTPGAQHYQNILRQEQLGAEAAANYLEFLRESM
ncbi:hypothetical protein GCM10027046_30660 [Uliginosibacterium flavum]|uniref:Uncharacterized protein n=1 Tax=Uliginosibacterium flavum TaxID=1396831 RepID=A0ABV2TG73_9RHOO